MVTLKDIAHKVGVDVSTVSKVLQGAPIRISPTKREEIERVAIELNYQPNTVARSLRTRRSGAVAMVVTSMPNYLYPEIIGGAEEAAEEHGIVLFLVKPNTHHQEEQLLGIVQQGRVDGLLFSDESPGSTSLEELREHQVPYVSLNRFGPDDRQYVALDDEAGFDAQAEYLVSLGHRRVAFIAVQPKSYISQLCQRSFLGSLARRGVPMPPSNVIHCDFGGDMCEAVVDGLFSLKPRPTAVATASAGVAVRLVETLRSRGIGVPDEISVIGYHEAPLALGSRVGVTTVKMPSRLQGRLGVERLLQVIEGLEFEGEIIRHPPEVVDRGTCTPVLRC